jgi:hypothetical protein
MRHVLINNILIKLNTIIIQEYNGGNYYSGEPMHDLGFLLFASIFLLLQLFAYPDIFVLHLTTRLTYDIDF